MRRLFSQSLKTIKQVSQISQSNMMCTTYHCNQESNNVKLELQTSITGLTRKLNRVHDVFRIICAYFIVSNMHIFKLCAQSVNDCFVRHQKAHKFFIDYYGYWERVLSTYIAFGDIFSKKCQYRKKNRTVKIIFFRFWRICV